MKKVIMFLVAMMALSMTTWSFESVNKNAVSGNSLEDIVLSKTASFDNVVDTIRRADPLKEGETLKWIMQDERLPFDYRLAAMKAVDVEKYRDVFEKIALQKLRFDSAWFSAEVVALLNPEKSITVLKRIAKDGHYDPLVRMAAIEKMGDPEPQEFQNEIMSMVVGSSINIYVASSKAYLYLDMKNFKEAMRISKSACANKYKKGVPSLHDSDVCSFYWQLQTDMVQSCVEAYGEEQCPSDRQNYPPAIIPAIILTKLVDEHKIGCSMRKEAAHLLFKSNWRAICKE